MITITHNISLTTANIHTPMSTIFSKIIAGEIPVYKVAESNEFLAFLDINPLVEGHLLVIPKKEVNRLFDLDDETYNGLMIFTKIIATAMKKVFPCDRIGMTVLGLEVPHAHIHLIPLTDMRDMDFSQPKLWYRPEEYQAIADRIKAAL